MIIYCAMKIQKYFGIISSFADSVTEALIKYKNASIVNNKNLEERRRLYTV